MAFDRVGEGDRPLVVGVLESRRPTDPGEALGTLQEPPPGEIVVCDEELLRHVRVGLEDVCRASAAYLRRSDSTSCVSHGGASTVRRRCASHPR